MPRLPAVDPATAERETKALLDAVQKKLGATPNVIRTIANAPAALTIIASRSPSPTMIGSARIDSIQNRPTE